MLRRLIARLLERMRLDYDIEALSSLDDRMLADMGVERHQIARRVRKG